MPLQRFIDAQERDEMYAIALAEIHAGRKQSHWIWYILPNLRGLGYSETARFYAIVGQAEAVAYYLHPLLGARLTEVAEAIVTVLSAEHTLEGIFGDVDAKKTISCMTLFQIVGTNTTVQDFCASSALSGCSADYSGSRRITRTTALCQHPNLVGNVTGLFSAHGG